MPLNSTPRVSQLPDVVLARDLKRLGHDDRSIARLLRGGSLRRVRHGAYVEDIATWDAMSPHERHRVRARAVLRQARTDVVLSHASALLEYGAPTWGVPLDYVDLTRTDGRSGRKEAGVRQHRGAITPSEIVLRSGVPVTAATRLAVEVMCCLQAEAALVAVNHLLGTGEADLDVIRRLAAERSSWPGSLSSHVVLRLADGAVESVGESRTVFACYRAGIPSPVRQYVVYESDGTVVARLDFAWPERGIWLEFDGRIKYGAGHAGSSSDVVFQEKRREDRVRQLTGWRCLRITWADLERPARFVAELRAALQIAS
ncbi:type IV toxin-antitoxin system AbiEi family antitoxin domain-containing protein [Nocardioides sp. R-C-SC26]|uniref:type IV toxin-antitoxin system AbiEi family antitoxin domain-containing protein n=1 Tax=Nocardioides sp. R-C-SC26 TaxID=2870414 RepID=UPI001E3E60C5|nr:type IV toxin-antitoxin system AbiEi family antitoxin domain-containing protein [Nocardioides sp. R-C-SC26]